MASFPSRVETVRLVLRRPIADDAAAYFAVFGDRDANATNPRGYCADLAAAESTLATLIANWDTNGHDVWTIYAGDRAIGFGGVGLRAFNDGHRENLGYGLHRSAWGNGYANEIAAASVDVARTAGCDELWARVRADNAASRRILEKLGFALAEGRAELVYRLAL